MAKITVKLVPAVDDLWEYVSPEHIGLIRCPVCFTPVEPSWKTQHIKHHQDILEVIKVLARGKGFNATG